MEKETLKIIEIYWDDELGAFHLNKVHDYLMESKKDYSKLLYKYCKKVYDKSAEDTERRYNQELKKISLKNNIQIEELATLFKPNQEVTDTLENKVFQAADSTLNRVDKNISKVVSESYYSGVGLDEITRNIAKEYNSLSTWEAERIARTEINCASNAAAFDSYVDLGVDFNKWWTGEDNNVRDSHRSLHGKIVRVGSKFSNGLMYPGDRSGALKEWINCRCTTVPFIMPLGKMAPPGLMEFTEDELIDVPGYVPISVEDALNANYPLEYFTQGGVLDQAHTVQSPMLELTNTFKQELRGIVDETDLDKVSKELAHFHLGTTDLRYERLNLYDDELKELLRFKTDFAENSVSIPEEISRFKLSIHNHPKGSSCLPSSADIFQMRFSKYGLTSTSNNGFVVMRSKSGFYNHSIDDLRDATDSFDCKVSREFAHSNYGKDYIIKVQNKFERGIISEEQAKMAINSRYHRYLNKNINRFSDELNEVLEEFGIDVKYIKNPNLKNKNYLNKSITESRVLRNNQNHTFNNLFRNLTPEETLEYEELKAIGKNNLGLIKRHRLKELEKLMKQDPPSGELKNINTYKPKSLVYSDEDAQLKKLLKNKKRFEGWTSEEKELYDYLNDKQQFKKTAEHIKKGEKLDLVDSEYYFKFYKKYGKKGYISKLDTDKLTTSRGRQHYLNYYEDLDYIDSKFALSEKELNKIHQLKCKAHFGEKLSIKERDELYDLVCQDNFDTLYRIRLDTQGLGYKENRNYNKLYNALKTKLKLTDDLLENLDKPIESEIPLEQITNKTRLKQFSGTTDDGLLPGGDTLLNWFTQDTRKLSKYQQKVSQMWLTSDYKYFTEFEKCERNKSKFAQSIVNSPKFWDSNIDSALRKADEIEYYTSTLDNILNNQIKKPMTVWRVQEEPFLGINPKIGDKIHVINFRSTAISKEGALWFSKTDRKPMKYIIEYELPTGTKGAYYAPIKTGSKEIDGVKENYAREMEFLLKEHDVEIIEFEDKTIKGALGENLKHIKLRVIN